MQVGVASWNVCTLGELPSNFHALALAGNGTIRKPATNAQPIGTSTIGFLAVLQTWERDRSAFRRARLKELVEALQRLAGIQPDGGTEPDPKPKESP